VPHLVARLKTLDLENANLKRLLVEKGLGKDMLRMVAVLEMWWISSDPEFTAFSVGSRAFHSVFST